MADGNRHFSSMLNNPNLKIKGSKLEDPLRRRLRRMAQTLVNKDIQDMQKPAIFRLRRASWEEWLKLTIGLFCSGIFLYQDYDRVMYYLSVPVAVDVNIVQQEDLHFPAVTICLTDFAQLTNVLLPAAKIAKLSSCDEETNQTGQQVTMNNIDFWKGRTDINTTWIVAQLEPNFTVKQEKFMVRPQGICTTYYVDKSVKFRGSRQKLNFDLTPLRFKCPPFFPRLFCVHHLEEKPHHKDFLGILGFRGADFGLGVTKYKSLNLRRKPCSDVGAYWKCIEKCLTMLWPKLIPCRYHYLSPELSDFPICNNRSMFQKAFGRSFGKMAEMDPEHQCKCTHPCSRTVFKMNYRPRPQSEKVQRLALFFEDDYITVIEERIAYGFIALVCDVGGIMGLYLGWSLLSICSLIQIILPRSDNSFVKQQNSWAFDPIYKKVRRNYDLLKARNKIGFVKLLQERNFATITSAGKTPFKYIRKVLFVLCLICCTYISYDRVMVYMSTPVITIVDVQPQTKVDFPVLTYCQDLNITIEYKEKLAEIRNLKSYCEVEFLDLLDLPGMTIAKLWEIGSTNEEVILNKYYKHQRIQILGESCLEISLGKRVHNGRNIFETVEIAPQCGEAQKVYITPPGSEFDFSHYYIVSLDTHYPRLEFEIQEQRVSPILANCLKAEDAKFCRQTCIKKKVMEMLKCRLPMMPAANDSIPLCTSTLTAKQSKAKYIEILTTTNTIHDCKCQRECHKIIFESDIFVIPGTPFYPKHLISMRVGFREPDRTIYTELPFYTSTKLFCDIGGILGLLLGFSFLEFMGVVINAASKSLKKIL